ncbi:adenylate/guanylate cyclase domain-containing protein [Azospirillum doebereinerae]|uniref:Adenylate/guanylate cyclase domain-containing protein n=1 Tax=Azospirillum doebereinerae TaxID=92933 RepID=A0A3S0WUW8_9PROT|nr:adenylate/guanylate cyclase domain-containing protein [Azospirillum doebereinerae]MCG5244050.1 adenylate/guanylate cyclase domain-containing protein [Azospirillum doebereinerae]RUQ70792.1 adenylate/guanylate cyclase domain-containing protein [Azospirillum doebereinerae]
MSLSQAFRDPMSKVSGTIVFFDLVGSTIMKFAEPEISWLPKIGDFLDIISSEVKKEEGGEIIKYLGDGAMAFYHIDNATEAINASIRIQVKLALQRKNGENNNFCKIGISSGKIYSAKTPNDFVDYFGTVADKAQRLCSASEKNGIFIDEATRDECRPNKITSPLGSAKSREGRDYLSKEASLWLKGFSKPVQYFEIIWDEQGFGPNVDAISYTTSGGQLKSNNSEPSPKHDIENHDQIKSNINDRTKWMKGVISANKGQFGFINGADGNTYFFDGNTSIPDLHPENSKIFFHPLPPRPGKRYPIAGNVICIGSELNGTIINKNKERSFCFVSINGARQPNANVYVSLKDEEEVENGDFVSFEIAENQFGPYAKGILRDQ